MIKPKMIVYFSSTHWDREWYLSQRSFQFRLMDVMDNIISTLENDSNFNSFTLDGQSILLDDYLDIRTDMKSSIERLLKDKRLIAGPWLTMPDETLSSGESLINNLKQGIQLVRKFDAEPMHNGFLCDTFGHISQMPQILNNFNIKTALVGRGTNQHEIKSYFNWKSPDGSSCLTFKVPEEYGYATFNFDVIAPFLDGRDPDKDRLLERAINYVNNELNRNNLPYVILMDAMDHEPIHPIAPWLCDELSKTFDCPVIIGPPTLILDHLLENSYNLPKVVGELRDTAKAFVEHNKLIPHTLSSRYDVKKLNDLSENLYEKVACPLAVINNLRDKTIPKGFFQVIERLLSENQFHDSICGCSIDSVNRDVISRYEEALNIITEIIDSASTSLTNLVDRPRDHDTLARIPMDFIKDGIVDVKERIDKADIMKLTIINPHVVPDEKVVITDIAFPTDYTANYMEYLAYEYQNMFRIYDSNDNEIPYQILDVKEGQYSSQPLEFYRTKKDIYKIALTADLPANNHIELAIRPSETPVRNFGSLISGNLKAENEFIEFKIHDNGSITINDKKTGESYGPLLLFRDYGELGDGWFHRKPLANTVVYADASPTDIELLHDGSELCTFAITKYINLPSHMIQEPPYAYRSNEKVTLALEAQVTLRKTSPWLDIKLIVNNIVKDHKLTVAFDTMIQSESYLADQAFALVNRKSGIVQESHDWKEADFGDHSFSNMIIRRDASYNRGFAFFSKAGLHECRVLDNDSGTIEVTLFRSFSNTFLTNGEPDGQIQGELEFNFALMPVNPNLSDGQIALIRDRYLSPTISYSNIENSSYRPSTPLDGFKLISKEVSLSTIKPSIDSDYICVRLVSYAPIKETISLSCPFIIEKAFTSNMLEEDRHPIHFEKNTINLTISPYKIVTILIKANKNN